MQLQTLNILIVLLSTLSATCAASGSEFSYSGAEFITFSGNITGSISYPPESDCPPFAESYARTNLYVGQNAPWDTNPFFFELSHVATNAPSLFTYDLIFNLDFSSSAYECYKDGRPCTGYIVFDFDLVPQVYLDLNKSKIAKTQVEGKDGYAVTGDSKAWTGNGTGNGVDISSSCYKANADFGNFKWNSSTPFTYNLSFSNDTASLKITTTISNTEMILSFTGPRNETATSLRKYPIQLNASDDAVPKFNYFNGSDIHFAKFGSSWRAAATPIPTASSRASRSSATTTRAGPTGSTAPGPKGNTAGGGREGAVTEVWVCVLGVAAVLAVV